MKLTDYLNAFFELCWLGMWAFVIITVVGFKDVWVEVFIARPELGGLLAWVMTLIIAVQGIKYCRFDGISKAIKELWKGWKE